MDTEGRSSFGGEEGTVAALCYFLGAGFYIYFKEQKSSFVRFHAVQSILGFAAIGSFWLMVRLIPILHFLSWSPSLIAIGFSLFMMYRAHFGEEYKLPVIGKLAFGLVYEEREDFLGPSEADSQEKHT